MKRRFPLTGRQSILATAVFVSLVGCSIRSSASGGAKAGGDADAKSSGKSESSASTSAKTKSKSSSGSTFRVSTSTSVKSSSKGSVKGSAKGSGSSSASASASGSTKGSASASGKASGSASGGGKIVFKTKPRAAHISTRKTEKKFVGISLVAKIRAQGSLAVKGSGSGSVKGGGSTKDPKDPKPTTKDPKPTTPKDPKPTTPDPKPTTPKDPKPTTPKDPKPTTPDPKPTTPKDPKPTTPTDPPPVVVDPPPVVVIDPPEEPPDNVFGYEDPVRGCFEGIVYPLSENAQALPTNYSALNPISVVYACEWDIPTREWSTGFPGIADHFEWFAIRYSGGFSVDVAGDWTFRISSDDGAKLIIDGKVVINNDGQHPPQEKSGTVTLSKGDHDMVLEYFQGPRYHINLQLYSTAPGGTEGIFSVR